MLLDTVLLPQRQLDALFFFFFLAPSPSFYIMIISFHSFGSAGPVRG